MANINLGRVLLGGLIAGLVINASEFVLNGVVLAQQWTDLMVSLHRPQLGMHEIVLFNILGFLQGIIAVWTYAAIRPRFGAGPKTAVTAALLTWVTTYFFVDAMPTISGMLTLSIMVTLLAAGLAEIIVATLAGAWFYKEAA